MARPRLDDSTRDDILDAVDLLLGRFGYGKMSIADVAREAGIGKGTVYLFFPSKEELVLSAIDRIAERLLTESQAIADGPGPLIARLRRCLLVRVLARFDGAQSHTPSLDELLAVLRPELLQRRQGHFHREARLLEKLLIEGRRQGVLSFVGARATADALVTATNALLPYSLSRRELGERRLIETRATRVIDLLLTGLRAGVPSKGTPR
ncbi:MAG TPA: TetR/AcrR family transcriptional regulator [Pseudomonadota bacterium]|nr:TetR/AcrR family transcriptional regulator [Pseudomonadota bacterium]